MPAGPAGGGSSIGSWGFGEGAARGGSDETTIYWQVSHFADSITVILSQKKKTKSLFVEKRQTQLSNACKGILICILCAEREKRNRRALAVYPL